MEEAKKYTRSYSQLSSYAQCSEAYRLERIARPRPPKRPASWLIGGTAFQAAVDNWEISGRTSDIRKDFVDLYIAGIEELKQEQPDFDLWLKPPRTKTVEADIENRMKAGLKTWIPHYEAYAETAEWEIWQTPFNEPAFEIQLDWTFDNGTTVKLAIDRVSWWPKQRILSLEDIKTGNRQKSNAQLLLYLYVFSKVFGDELEGPVEYARFWYSKDGVASEWCKAPADNGQRLAEVYGTLDRGIENRVFIPNPGDHCGLCAVRPWCRSEGWLKEGEPLKKGGD